MNGNPHRAVFVNMTGSHLPGGARYPEATATLSDLTLELLAFAEGRFLTIHPFSDFNGPTIRLFLRELLRRLDFPRVILEPDTDAGRAACFGALEAADHSTADYAQILVVRADPDPGDALPTPRGERAESITHPHRPVIAYFLEVQRRFPPRRRRTGPAEAGERASQALAGSANGRGGGARDKRWPAQGRARRQLFKALAETCLGRGNHRAALRVRRRFPVRVVRGAH